ncbi:MAG: two-component system, sensor histidine kinase PdtaS [Actinomycetota bacterium]|jgi:two-component sensor histidine kinase|nr:two-component system, sensor histidine kinase PdtaS [Actinomycetota bacterium]
MATLDELARLHTRLEPTGLGHLKRLVGSWGMLSDLCFADLLLFVPVAGGPGTSKFVVLGQVRPTTSQTLHRDDLVGRIIDETERPLIARALRLGEIVEGELETQRGERARIQCIPVRWRGEVLAVLTRESAPAIGRRPGELERVYVETFDRFARMIVRGDFPFGGEDATEAEEAPRVGDGVLILDGGARIEYASPNAVSALHRMGISSNAEGMRLEELGIDESATSASYATLFPVTQEIERGSGVTVLLRSLPLVDDGGVTGAVVLMRDVTQLRRLDRLLLSKDATIREVHHRVKNNLQTISSLLRLQARRLDLPEAREALEEAERRIRAIARVHEILSREAVEQVPFDEIIDDLLRVAADSSHSLERSVEFVVDGDAGELPAEVATPLAVVLGEILQNAVEHAFDAADDFGVGPPAGHITLVLRNDGKVLELTVIDDGKGLPDDFAIERSDSLGLSIVKLLVTTQLGGTIELSTSADGGTVVRCVVPLEAPV